MLQLLNHLKISDVLLKAFQLRQGENGWKSNLFLDYTQISSLPIGNLGCQMFPVNFGSRAAGDEAAYLGFLTAGSCPTVAGPWSQLALSLALGYLPWLPPEARDQLTLEGWSHTIQAESHREPSSRVKIPTRYFRLAAACSCLQLQRSLATLANHPGNP